MKEEEKYLNFHMEQEDKNGVETEENNITVKALFQSLKTTVYQRRISLLKEGDFSQEINNMMKK